MENFAPSQLTTNEDNYAFVLTVELRNETTGELEGYYRLENAEFLGDEPGDRQEWNEACASGWRDYLRPMFRRMQPGEFIPATSVPGGQF